MRNFGIDLASRIIVGAVGLATLALFSHCTTRSNVEKKVGGECDLSQPREVSFSTYRNSYVDDRVRRTDHNYEISSEKTPEGKRVVSIYNAASKRTSDFSLKGTAKVFKYEVDGRTLDASLTTQHNIMGYRTDAKRSSGDVSALAPARTGDAAYASGMKEGLELIKQIESRAKCTMPKPSQIGAPSSGAW